MNTALEAFREMPSTRESADIMIERLKQEIQGGAVNPLELKIFFKHIERVMTEVTDTIQDEILAEAEKYGRRFELRDATVEIKELGVKWNFDKTQDPEYTKLEAKAKEATAALKARTEFLKTIPENGMEWTDPETGEMTKIYRGYKTSKTGLAITIGKGGGK
jgi:hypothetical protein